MIKEGYTRDQIIVSTNSHTFMGKGGFHIPINNLIQSRALGPFAVILSHEGSVLILKTPEWIRIINGIATIIDIQSLEVKLN